MQNIHHYFWSIIILSSAVFQIGCTPTLSKHVTIELSQYSTPSTTNNQEDIDKTLSIIKDRLGTLNLFYFDKQIVADTENKNRYTIMLPEKASDEQIQLLVSDVSEMEIWQVADKSKITVLIEIIQSDSKIRDLLINSSFYNENCLLLSNRQDSAIVMQSLDSLISNKNIQFRWGKDPNKTLDNITYGERKEEEHKRLYILEAQGLQTGPLLTSKYITKVSVESTPMATPVINIEMEKEGADKWEKITKKNIGKPLAIVVDNEVYSTPTVSDKISNGSTSISGAFTQQEAERLAFRLQAKKMPLGVTIIDIAQSK